MKSMLTPDLNEDSNSNTNVHLGRLANATSNNKNGQNGSAGHGSGILNDNTLKRKNMISDDNDSGRETIDGENRGQVQSQKATSVKYGTCSLPFQENQIDIGSKKTASAAALNQSLSIVNQNLNNLKTRAQKAKAMQLLNEINNQSNQLTRPTTISSSSSSNSLIQNSKLGQTTNKPDQSSSEVISAATSQQTDSSGCSNLQSVNDNDEDVDDLQPTPSPAHSCCSSSSSSHESQQAAHSASTLSSKCADAQTESWLNIFKEWNTKTKLNALEQILELCEHAHIKHVHNFIEPKLQRDYISDLPKELILHLLTYVRPKDLYKLSQVSTYWYQIANDPILWKNICKKFAIRVDLTVSTNFNCCEYHRNTFSASAGTLATTAASSPSPSPSPSPPPSTVNASSQEDDDDDDSELEQENVSVNNKKRKQAKTKSMKSNKSKKTNEVMSPKSIPFSEKLIQTVVPAVITNSGTSANGSCSSSNSSSGVSSPNLKYPYCFLNTFNPYKRAYIIDYNVTRNWCTRPLPRPIMLKSHDEHVITCLKFDGKRVVSGSDDNTLKVWCAQTGKLLNTLIGHTGGVWASQLKDNIVISGSTDRTVRVWNIDTGECVHVLTGHTSTVRCLALNGHTVISGSRDSLLRVWNIDTGACLQILRGHQAAVRCVCFDGTYVVSGSYDFTIRVWDPYRNKCLHVLEGHLNRVYSLLFDGHRIVSGSLDTTIIVWDVHTGSIIHKLTGHHSLTSGMQIKGDILVSGNADSTVKIWSLKSGECLHTLSGCNKHMSAVTCLAFNEKFVISSSDDGTVKLWNLETGEFIRNLLALESGGRGGVVWRISMHQNKLVCAVGSRIGVEETKLILLDFDWPPTISTSDTATTNGSPSTITTHSVNIPVNINSLITGALSSSSNANTNNNNQNVPNRITSGLYQMLNS